MSTNAIKSDIFKFVALRPPVSITKDKKELYFVHDERRIQKTAIGELITKLNEHDFREIPEQIKAFIKSKKYNPGFIKTYDSLNKIENFIISATSESFNSVLFKEKIENILGTSVPSFLENSDNRELLGTIWDHYYAFYLLSRFEHQNLDPLINALKVFHLLKYISESPVFDFDKLQHIMSAKLLISSFITELPKPLRKKEVVIEQEKSGEKISEYRKLWTYIIDTHRAIDELRNVKVNTVIHSIVKDAQDVSIPAGNPAPEQQILFKSSFSIDKDSWNNLHTATRSLLNSYNVTAQNFHVADTVMKLQEQLQNHYAAAANINDSYFMQQMPEEVKFNGSILSNVGRFLNSEIAAIPAPAPFNIRPLIKPLGIGELKVVKQKLKKYATGEVAHIENVLRGEYKERKHRVLDRTEDIFFTSSETEEETIRDTQTTERYELKKESEKTIQDEMSIQAGVTVSGSYGMVTFGAYGDFAYSTASQESNKSASNFAREVIDKSVSRIQKKTKEERTTKKLHEVEEINTHGIDNKEKANHAVGVYRWVDKYYEAQIYNYGSRMMFEFIIPEPAAFYEYARTHKPKKDIVRPITPYRWYLDNDNNWKHNGDLITHKDINENNFHLYIRDYNVQGVMMPPPLYKTISTAIAKEGMVVSLRDENQPDRLLEGAGFTLNNKELIVPKGYVSKVGVWFDVSAIWTAYSKMELIVGNKIFRILDLPVRKDEDGNMLFDNRFLTQNNASSTDGYHSFFQDTIIQVSVNCTDVLSYTINLYALVERLPEAYEQWQIDTFGKIMSAYKAMEIEYEQKLAAQEVQQGISILGQNPRINREIEETELKKSCIKMLMDVSQFGSFDAMKESISTDPDFDIMDALSEGKIIQFFEQAFEWENLTYLFYPYFWARKEKWMQKSGSYDNDPLFTKFLQAGSGRAVLPVRPGYNDVISYYMQTGSIWNIDGNPPLIKKEDGSPNDLFISIAEELKNQTDDLANAIPEGEPWEVVLPTTLVYLQDNSDLPKFD